MLKMVDGTGIIGVDMVCPLGVSTPQPPNYDKVELEGTGMLVLPNSLDAPLERLELIGNSVQGENPAPDNLQEIKNAGRKSKNLFDAKKAKSGWITTDGEQTLATLGSIDNVVSDYIQVYPGTKYTSSARVFQNFYDSEKNFLNHNTTPSTSIVVPDNAKYMIVVIAVNKALAIQTANTLMINIGSSALPYEQYTDKYLLDVKVTGKNLLNLQKEPDAKGTYQGWKVGNGELLTLGVKDKGNNADIKGCYIGFSDQGSESKGTVWVVDNGVIKANPLNQRRAYVSIFPANETTVKKLTERFDIQCELGNVATPYQPYTEQTMQIALDEPLRGIGEYNDVLTKDGVVMKIKRVVLDGSEDEEWRLDRRFENHINFALVIKGAITVNTGIRTMMDKFKYVRSIWNNDSPGQDMFDAKLRINMPKTLATDLQTFKTWLSQNPLTVDYVLAEPVTEPLPESVQAQLQALHSENGVTHVFVDSGEVPCGIKLTYRKEK